MAVPWVPRAGSGPPPRAILQSGSGLTPGASAVTLWSTVPGGPAPTHPPPEHPMLLTLTAISLRSALGRGRSGDKKPKLDLLDLPQYTRNELGLHGLNISTELLTGLTRDK